MESRRIVPLSFAHTMCFGRLPLACQCVVVDSPKNTAELGKPPLWSDCSDRKKELAFCVKIQDNTVKNAQNARKTGENEVSFDFISRILSERFLLLLEAVKAFFRKRHDQIADPINNTHKQRSDQIIACLGIGICGKQEKEQKRNQCNDIMQEQAQCF